MGNYTSLQVDIGLYSQEINLGPILPTIMDEGQKSLENILVTSTINHPAMMSFSSAITPRLPKDSNILALPSDYLAMIYFNIADQLPSPWGVSLASTTGTLGAATYYYRVSAYNSDGETIPSTETSIVLASTGGVIISWTQMADTVKNVTGYKVYGRSTGAEQLIATITSSSTVSYTDTGSITPSGAMPTANTTGTKKYSIIDRIKAKRHADTRSYSIDIDSAQRPTSCARINDNLYFDYYTNKNYAYEMLYLKRLTTLSTTNPTNEWSNNAYMPLLFCCLVKLLPFLANDERREMWERARDEEISLYKNLLKIERYSGSAERNRSPNVVFAE